MAASIQRGRTPKEGSLQKTSGAERTVAFSNHGSASPPVLGTLEAAKALSVLVDLLGASSSSVVLGMKSENSDPICEGLSRIINRQAPLLIQREIIPGNPETTESFDIREMVMDSSYARACLDFRLDTMVPESGMRYEDIISRLGQWKSPLAVTGSYVAVDEEDSSDEEEA